MTTGAANGHAHAWVDAAPDVRSAPNGAHEVVDFAPAAVLARSTLALADTAELYRALSTSQQQVVTALRQIDTLQKRDELLKQEVNQLAQAVVQARRSAHYDHLTGLPNRTLLLDRFNQAAARGARQHKLVALLFLDLDGFKSINDALGHTAGDRLLQQVAARLTASIRKSDTACRYGGDEFVVLLPELEHRENAVTAAEKIRAHLATPYVLDGTPIQVMASIGMAVCPIDGSEFGDLIQQADAAMYRNKVHDPARPQSLRSDKQIHDA
jgi:diguanylate cyclase (GGDEF)-like protein